MKRIANAVSILLCFCTGAAWAQDSAGVTHTPLIELSTAFGGDALGELVFTDGSSQELKAGNGVTVSAGIDQQYTDSFGIKYAVGYKYSTSAANNLDVRKSAIPVDVIPYYRVDKHRFGAGLTYHLSPEFYMETLGTAEFDNATGYVVEYTYSKFTLAYTGIDYRVAGEDFDASNLGFRFLWRFE